MLTSAALQLIATLTMLIDHIGAFMLDSPLVLRAIGRIAMPLFCFMLTEGFLHTEGKRVRYLGRIVVFAFISQLAFDLAHYAASGSQITALPNFLASNTFGHHCHLNVLFTLALGFITMLLIEKSNWFILCLPAFLTIAEFLNTDYGAYGVLLVVGFYLSSKYFSKKKHLVWRCLGYTATLFTVTTLHATLEYRPIQLFALFAIFPILLYNGKLGHRLPKWFGYIFYPAHLFVISGLLFLLPG